MSTKNTCLSVRLSKKEKNKIAKKASNLGLKTSDYVRNACLDTKGERITMCKLVYVTTVLQEVCNYVEKNYNEDEFMKEVTKKLWNSLS